MARLLALSKDTVFSLLGCPAGPLSPWPRVNGAAHSQTRNLTLEDTLRDTCLGLKWRGQAQFRNQLFSVFKQRMTTDQCYIHCRLLTPVLLSRKTHRVLRYALRPAQTPTSFTCTVVYTLTKAICPQSYNGKQQSDLARYPQYTLPHYLGCSLYLSHFGLMSRSV